VKYERSYTSMMEIETGCQVQGCSRRSRVVIIVAQKASRDNDEPEVAISFACKKHAEQIRKHKAAEQS
jgi:hypothetical protein